MIGSAALDTGTGRSRRRRRRCCSGLTGGAAERRPDEPECLATTTGESGTGIGGCDAGGSKSTSSSSSSAMTIGSVEAGIELVLPKGDARAGVLSLRGAPADVRRTLARVTSSRFSGSSIPASSPVTAGESPLRASLLLLGLLLASLTVTSLVPRSSLRGLAGCVERMGVGASGAVVGRLSRWPASSDASVLCALSVPSAPSS